jgi:hypothetical protein
MLLLTRVALGAVVDIAGPTVSSLTGDLTTGSVTAPERPSPAPSSSPP